MNRGPRITSATGRRINVVHGI